MIRCEKCDNELPVGANAFRDGDNDLWFCSDRCLHMHLDDACGSGYWVKDPEENADGGYFSYFQDGYWHNLNIYWTVVFAEDEEDGTVDVML